MENFVTDDSAKRVLRGVVREAIAKVPSDNQIRSFMFTNMKAMDRKRDVAIKKIQAWSKDWHTAQFAYHYGRVTNISIIVPKFIETEYGWELRQRLFNLSYTSHEHLYDDQYLNFAVTGHALERFFQRGREITWPAVVAEQKSLSQMYHLFEVLYEQGGGRVVMPSASGVYLGELVGHTRVIKTFVRADNNKYTNLRGRLQTIVDQFPFHPAMLFDEVAYSNKKELMRKHVDLLMADFPFLREPYTPELD